MFCRCWSRWPRMVASDVGKNLLMLSAVKPGKPMKWLLRQARRRDDLAGLKRQAWTKRRTSDGCDVSMTLLIAGFVDLCHRPLGARVPMGTVLELTLAKTESLVKVMASQPLSMSLLTDANDLVKPGRMSVWQADGGMPGMTSVPVWVEVRVPESGSSTVMGSWAGCRLMMSLVGGA